MSSTLLAIDAPLNSEGFILSGSSNVLWTFISSAVRITPLTLDLTVPRNSQLICAPELGSKLHSEI